MPETLRRYLATSLAVKISRTPLPLHNPPANSIHPCRLSMPCQELQKKSQLQCRINRLGKLNVGVLGCCTLLIRLWPALLARKS
jgi:hypothetical protein